MVDNAHYEKTKSDEFLCFKFVPVVNILWDFFV